MLYTKTVLQFCELVVKILTKTSEEADDRVENYDLTAEGKTIRQGTSGSNRTVAIRAKQTYFARAT